MGIFDDEAVRECASVTGVIPSQLTETEMSHPGLSRLVATQDIRPRKAETHRLSDAFIALPGGLGKRDR